MWMYNFIDARNPPDHDGREGFLGIQLDNKKFLISIPLPATLKNVDLFNEAIKKCLLLSIRELSHLPLSSIARMVSMIWAWGLCPGGALAGSIISVYTIPRLWV